MLLSTNLKYSIRSVKTRLTEFRFINFVHITTKLSKYLLRIFLFLNIKKKHYIKGRGAQINTHNRFLQHQKIITNEFLNYCEEQGDSSDDFKTTYIKIFPKTILNKVASPDIGFAYSMNPYQGCEHGCIYCYARNTHEYWGYSAGLDFEQKILYKSNAAELLKKKLSSTRWKPTNIMLSGNTDCYQPIEKKLELTRDILKVFLKYRHPVSIISKNALILRDLDILTELNTLNLVHVSISITSLNENTRRTLEPRTASVKKRLETVKQLSKNKIPVNVMMAPIIPAINSQEIFEMAKTVYKAGASSIAYTMVRLNGAIGYIFTNWVRKIYPDRSDKIINQIKNCHGGKLNDSRFNLRIRGEGNIAHQIQQQFKIAKKKYFADRCMRPLDYSHYTNGKPEQLKFF
ncbi:MAG: radical SAM protein [Flavobacteriales bacterium]|nr:MAG: radical SAM protein [Flavobacteriales bacterium]